MGSQTATNDPDLGVWSYQYFDDGSLKQRTDANSVVTNCTYDALGRPLTRTYVGSTYGGPVTYTYDTCQIGTCTVGQIGHITKSTHLTGGGEDKYRYDARGRVETEEHTINLTTYTMSHGYDAMDREISTTYPGAEDRRA